MSVCRTCGDVSREASNATGRHIWPHGSDSLRCDGCGKMFVSVERMQQQRAAGIAQGRKLEREAVVALLRTQRAQDCRECPGADHYAYLVEEGEHRKGGE